MELYLKQALDSVVHQTMADIEIICIDDCSTDNSFSILNEYAKNDKRFVVIKHKCNQGLGETRNDGLNVVTGEYIMFLDPDDWLELDACEKAYNQISKNKDDVVFFNSQTCDVDGNILSVNRKLSAYKKHLDGKTFSLKKIKGNFLIRKISCWTRIYDSEFIRRNNIYMAETRRAEDILFSLKIYLNAENVSVLNAVLYNYRAQPSYRVFKELENIDDAYINLKEAYLLVKNNPDNGYILKHFLVYLIDVCIMKRYYGFICNRNQKALLYKKSRKLLKYINKREKIKKIYEKIDVVKYKLFLLCPNSFIYEIAYKMYMKIFADNK